MLGCPPNPWESLKKDSSPCKARSGQPASQQNTSQYVPNWIHRFVHQLAHHGRSGGLSTAKIHDFSARVFLYRSNKPYILKFLQFWRFTELTKSKNQGMPFLSEKDACGALIGHTKLINTSNTHINISKHIWININRCKFIWINTKSI